MHVLENDGEFLFAKSFAVTYTSSTVPVLFVSHPSIAFWDCLESNIPCCLTQWVAMRALWLSSLSSPQFLGPARPGYNTVILLEEASPNQNCCWPQKQHNQVGGGSKQTEVSEWCQWLNLTAKKKCENEVTAQQMRKELKQLKERVAWLVWEQATCKPSLLLEQNKMHKQAEHDGKKT